MKKNTTTDLTCNTVDLTGEVTFCMPVSEGSTIYNVGLKVKYMSNGKEFTACPKIKVFESSVIKNNDFMMSEVETQDKVNVEAYFTTRKYTDKAGIDQFVTELVANKFNVL